MSRRLLLLLVAFSVAATIAVFRVKRSGSAAAKLEKQADEAAARFIRLRDGETAADRDLWGALEPYTRVEEALARLAAQGMATGDLGPMVLTLGPERFGSRRISWLHFEVVSARRESSGGSNSLSASFSCEITLVRTNGQDGVRWARFEADSAWSDEEIPRLLVFKPRQTRVLDSARPAFRHWAEITLATNGMGVFTDPMLLERRATDTRLVLLGAGVAVSRDVSGWRTEKFDSGNAERVAAAAFIDMSGEGQSDLVVAGSDGLRIRKSDGWKPLWIAPAKLRYPQSISAGDIDGDGDNDIWLTQYKAPYVGGQFPTPYFDANDGYPSYLLRNDGGTFTDITDAAGLASKRSRRTYGGSLVDLDDDGHADLVNVSDFAGVDIYLNDGSGNFTDITSRLGETRHLFGMAHAIADLNGDSLADLLAIGMDSSVASQMDALGLRRPDFPKHDPKRAAMTFGNRVYLGRLEKVPTTAHPKYDLAQAPWTDELRRGGWAWGVAVFDWNNDGLDDVYMANGHETFENRVDFERQFWTHDIYVGSSMNDPAAQLYFMQANERRRAARQSYGGWQANRMFTATTPGKYQENAWLQGVAVTEDCRNVIASDFDDDGRVDLAVTTFEQWPVFRQRLLILRNESDSSGNWIGFRFGGSTVGCRVELETVKGVRRHWFVTGDSYRSQSDFEAHFGLGDLSAVTKAELVLPDKRRITLPVGINHWHTVVKTP